MAKTTVHCDWCKIEFQIENKEFNRIRRQGRTEVYCSRSCSDHAINRNNPHLGEMGKRHFIQWNAENSQDPWHQHRAHLASQMWKYQDIHDMLNEMGIEHIFECPLKPFGKLYLFDLFIPSLNLFIEFDGKHHCGALLPYDAEKEMTARCVGYNVVRIEVEASVVYPREIMGWLSTL